MSAQKRQCDAEHKAPPKVRQAGVCQQHLSRRHGNAVNPLITPDFPAAADRGPEGSYRTAIAAIPVSALGRHVKTRTHAHNRVRNECKNEGTHPRACG